MKQLLCLTVLLLSFTLVDAGESTELIPISVDNVSNLEQLQIVGRGTFSAADISPDGKTLAVGTTAGVWFYELDNLTVAPVYHQYGSGFVTSVRFDVTGAYLEITNFYPDVGGVSTFGLLQLDEALNVVGTIESARLSDDRHYILYQDGSRIDISTNEEVHISFPTIESFAPDLSSVVIHPDQSHMVVKPIATNPASRVQEFRLYSQSENRYVASIRMSEDSAARHFGKLIFSERGEWLIGVVAQYVPTYTTAVYKWSVAELITGETTQYDDGLVIWDSASANVANLYAVNDRIFVTSRASETYEQTIDVIDLIDGTVQARLQNTFGIVHPSTGDLFAFETSNGAEWTLSNVSSNELVGTLDDFGGSVKDVAFNANETQMLSINQRIDANAIEVFVHLRNATTWESISSLHLANQIETLIGFQPDGRPIVVSAAGWQDESEKYVDIWDIELGETLYSFQVNSSPFIALSEDSRFLFVSEGGNRWLYDINNPQNPQPIVLPSSELISSIGFFDLESRYLALIESEGNSHLLRLWDINQQAEVSRITNRRIVLNPFANTIQFVNNGELMILCEVRNSRGGQLDYQMTFWQFEDLLSQTFPSPYMTVSSTLCRLDFGLRSDFVVPSYGAGVQNWSTILANTNARSEGDEWWRVAKFGPDGTVVFGIDYYGEMSAWDASDMSDLSAFQVSPWHVDQINFIHDGTIMVLPASDGTVRLWGVPASAG
jgi:WD40 repeat protein